jgi:hypothetical protein
MTAPSHGKTAVFEKATDTPSSITRALTPWFRQDGAARDEINRSHCGAYDRIHPPSTGPLDDTTTERCASKMKSSIQSRSGFSGKDDRRAEPVPFLGRDQGLRCVTSASVP